MPTDATIIASHGPHDVLGQHVLLRWPDDSSLALHWVAIHGHIRPHLRALCADGLHWVVVDVRRLGSPTLADDIDALERQAADAVIAWHLVRQLPHAEALARQALAVREAAWTLPQQVAA